jgi:amino acid permease
MKDPSRFDRILRNTLIVIMIILILFGVCSYVAYGSGIEDMVTMNLPQNNFT